MTAREALTSQDYEALRSYFGEQIDTETRVKLCSCALVNLLRHAMGLGDTVQLAPDGSMTVQQIMGMNVSRILRMTITEIEEAMRENDREGCQRKRNIQVRGISKCRWSLARRPSLARI